MRTRSKLLDRFRLVAVVAALLIGAVFSGPVVLGETITHTFVSPKGDGPDDTVVRPSAWNAAHTLVRTPKTKSSNYTIATDGTGAITDDEVHCSGTMTLTIPAAVGSGRRCMIVMDAGTVAVTIARSGSDTIGTLTTLTFSVPGAAFMIDDAATGKWGLLAATGNTATDTTPPALSGGGTSPLYSRLDHTHRSPGSIAVVTSQTSVGPSSNAETTLLTDTLPTGILAAGTTFRFHIEGTVQLQATSGALTFKMYVGATAGQTVVMATRGILAAAPFLFDGTATVRSTGGSGTYITTGEFRFITGATAVGVQAQGGASTTTVDTTAATPVVKLTAQFATSSTTNILLVQTGAIEISAL